MRTAAMLCLAFGALLRLAELRELRISDVVAHPEHIVIRVRRSKTDQLKLGGVRLVPAMPGAEVCPVTVFAAYREALMAAVPAPPSEEESMWPAIAAGEVCAPMWGRGQLSVDSARRELRAVCVACGLDPASFSWHSCRAGGATAAARHGVDTPLLQVLGAWKSDAWRSYVRWADDCLLQAAARVWAPAQPIDAGAAPSAAAVAPSPGEFSVPIAVLSPPAPTAVPVQPSTDGERLVAEVVSALFSEADEDTVVIPLASPAPPPSQARRGARPHRPFNKWM